ncbi:MAG: hypothetical protein L0215_16035 [Gemmataceae bacterium]|nr:hypothetical protein [Gemmataceae bacterium]
MNQEQPLRKWFHVARVFESIMAFTESARTRARTLFRQWKCGKKPYRPSRNKPMFPKLYPHIEGLERREVPTLVRFTSANFIVGEASGPATVLVELDASSAQTITVNYATSNGTATSGGDYTSTSGTLTFVPSDTSESFTVAITNNATDEYDETFSVTLSNATNATISGTNPATVTIQDDDAWWTAGAQALVPDPLQGDSVVFASASEYTVRMGDINVQAKVSLEVEEDSICGCGDLVPIAPVPLPVIPASLAA